MAENWQVFSKEINIIKNKGLQLLVKKCLDATPKEFWTKPASSSGKYHPRFAQGDGGLIRHTKVVFMFCDHMTATKTVKYSDGSRDLLLASAILHDSIKFGFNGSSHTLQEHPMLAATHIDSTYRTWHKMINSELLPYFDGDVSAADAFVETLCGIVAAHMGEWWTITPKTPLERVFHLADYLASRKEFETAFLEWNGVS